MNLIPMILSLMVSAGEDTSPVEAAREAVKKGLPPIASIEYPNHRVCFSCHHQAVPVVAMVEAQKRGFRVNPEAIQAAIDVTHDDLEAALPSYKKGSGQGGGVTRAAYALLTLDVGGAVPDDVTSAVAGFLRDRDSGRGHWFTSSNRPPSEASHFTTTYLALRALNRFGRSEGRRKNAERVAEARLWLVATSPKDTEDRVFRLLALEEANAPRDVIASAAGALRAAQREDGGWSQREGDPSDAYATGSSLVALNLAGDVATNDDAYVRGMRFLIGSQKEDGTWFVSSRSRPFQTYFESGFPHGKDQFISMAASSWAVAALARACPKP